MRILTGLNFVPDNDDDGLRDGGGDDQDDDDGVVTLSILTRT